MHTEGLGGFNEPQHGVELSILGVVLLEIDLTSTAHAYGPGGQQGHNGNPLHQLKVPARSQPLSSISLSAGISSQSLLGKQWELQAPIFISRRSSAW